MTPQQYLDYAAQATHAPWSCVDEGDLPQGKLGVMSEAPIEQVTLNYQLRAEDAKFVAAARNVGRELGQLWLACEEAAQKGLLPEDIRNALQALRDLKIGKHGTWTY